VGVPGRVVFQNGKRVVITDPKQINDPLSDTLADLAAQLKLLNSKVRDLEEAGQRNRLATPEPAKPDRDYQI
jgi:serine O-acetyltransferase